MRDMLFAVLGLISAAVAAYFMYSYMHNQGRAEASMTPFIIAVIFALLALICGGLFLSNRVNRQEEIHITE